MTIKEILFKNKMRALTLALLGGLMFFTSQAEAQIAEGKDKWLGNVHSSTQVERFTNYWNQVTPENSGKWGSVEGTRDQMNWNNLDEAYALAKDNGYPFRFHVLVWGAQQPGWMNDLSTDEQLEEIEEWFQAVAERYPDIDYLEVVNEPLHQRPDGDTGDADYWDALGGSGETGWDWVIKSFEMAREIFPDSVKLMINDYGIVNSGNNVREYSEIINLLKERNLIDRIGVQAHAFSNGGCNAGYCGGITASVLTDNLNALGELNLPIQATELDIDGNSDLDDDSSEEIQLERYQRIFPIFWEHPAVEGVTLWGWMPGMWRSDQDAFIFNQRPQPALDWLEEYVDTANVEITVSNEDFIADVPEGFELNQNYPNPFNPTTQISYTLPSATDVSLNVYDVTGRQIEKLVNTRQSSGNYSVSFNASKLPSGMYFYRIEAGGFADVKQMMLIK